MPVGECPLLAHFLIPLETDGWQECRVLQELMMSDYKFLFGPVPSRRFERSLGVDLTPYKACSQDCVFCQLGRTTNKTLARMEYVTRQLGRPCYEQQCPKCGTVTTRE
jgi:hypothetical protein